MSGHDIVGIRELLESFVPFIACCGYIESKSFVSKSESFERGHRIIWFKISIRKSICNSERVSCTDIVMIPHSCFYIGKTFFSGCCNRHIGCSQQYREEFCSCDIIFCSISAISVSVRESLRLEIEYGIFVP